MVETSSKKTTICQIEQLCRVVSAVSQGQVFLEPPSGSSYPVKPEGAEGRYARETHAGATEGLLTSEIVEGRLAGWLFS